VRTPPSFAARDAGFAGLTLALCRGKVPTF
jgi:hypothetical protein